MRGKRFVSLVAAVLLSFGLVFGALAPAPAAAQADELSQREFEDLIETVQEDAPAFGPEDGELEHDPDTVSLFAAEQGVADFLATVTFANPYAGSSQQFDVGIYFRVSGSENDLRYLQFIVLSNGEWALLDSAAEDLVAQGDYDDLDDSRRGENQLTIHAEGPVVHLGINGDYVGSAEVDHEDAGDILIATAFLEESRQEGEASEFTNFTIWELGGSSRSNNDQGEDEPTPDEEDVADDSGNRGPLGPRDTNPSQNDDDEETPTEEAEEEPTRDNDNSSGGTVYMAPIYGYTLEYDESIWDVESDDSADDGQPDSSFDHLALTTEFSQLSIFGISTDETPEECAAGDVQQFADALEESGLPDAVTVVDEGEVSRGPLDGAAFVEAVIVTPDEEGNDVETTYYVICGPLEGSDAVILVNHIVPADEFAAESELRDDILATLSAGDGSATDGGNDDGPSRDDEETPVEEDEPTPTPEDDQPSRDEEDSGNRPADGALYESPSYGYTFRYDDSNWELSDSSEDGVDTAILTNGSTLSIFGLPAQDDSVECRDSLLNGFVGSLDEAGLTGEIETVDDGEIEDGPLAGSAFVRVEITGENEDGDPLVLAIYVSCGPHGDGDYSIAVRQFAAASSYDDEADLRDEITSTILAAGEVSGDSGNQDDQPSRDDEEDRPTEEAEDQPAPGGARYESPTYGYSLLFDDSVWELTGESSTDGLDSASFGNGISTVTVFGLSLDANPAECAGALLSSFLTQLEDNGITGDFELLNEGELSGGSLDGAVVIEVLFTGETDEGAVTLVIYTACGSIGGSDHYVGVRHFASPDQYEGEAAARDELLAGLYAPGEEPQVDTGDEPSRDDEGSDTPNRDDSDDNGGDSGDVDSPNVSRVDGANIYTSPTYGFTVEIQPGFSVEQDTVANGYDTLVISNSKARITVAGFASSNTAAACADSIVGNLNADPSFTNVTVPVDEQGVPIRIDEQGFSAVPVYLTFNENGQQVTVGRLYACFSFTGVNGGSSMLVYAYETPADIFIDEFDNIVAMLDLILVP